MTEKTPIPRIEFSEYFNKRLNAAPREIRAAFLETIQLFRDNQLHLSLRNHILKNKLAGFRSIDVTDDWRALYKESQSAERTIITFDAIGTHKDLYRWS